MVVTGTMPRLAADRRGMRVRPDSDLFSALSQRGGASRILPAAPASGWHNPELRNVAKFRSCRATPLASW